MGNILDKLFKAKTAKEIVKSFYKDDLNYQRSFVLDRIKGASLNGCSSIVIDYGGVKLYEEDYEFFKRLGYTVYPETYTTFSKVADKTEYYKFTYGIISWED